MAKPLIIDNWQKGVAPSPHLGFTRIVNCDISTSPGGLKVNRGTTNKSAGIVDATVNWIRRDPDTPSNIFALDGNGVLYKSDNNGTTWAEVSVRGGAGQGLVVVWGYVFVFCDTTIDVMKISDSTWTDDWATIGAEDSWHPAFMSEKDGIIYYGCGRYVGKIEQLTTFDPGNASTYNITLGTSASNSLQLPENHRIKCIEELGNNLMFGTWQGTLAFHFRKATIFPWDASSPTYGEPIKIEENGVHAMLVMNNNLYILAGTVGAIYASNGFSASKIAQIPESLMSVSTDTNAGAIDYFPGAIMPQRNKIFFGVGNAVEVVGVYSLDLQTGVIQVEHLISTGRDGSLQELSVNALLGISYLDFLIGWYDKYTESYGIDLTGGKYTGFTAYAESALFQVGTLKKLRAFTELEFTLAKSLATGQGVKVKYRKNLSDSWTTINEYLFSGTPDADTRIVGAKISYNDIIKIEDVETIQVRVELTTSGTGDFLTSIIILWLLFCY